MSFPWLKSNKKISINTLLVFFYATVLITSVAIINQTYSNLIKEGWLADIKHSFELRTFDFSQMIQQDVLSGSYPNVINKAMRELDRPDLIKLEIILTDGYVIFSQNKNPSLNDQNTVEVTTPILQVTGIKMNDPIPQLGSIKTVFKLDEMIQNINQRKKLVYKWFLAILVFTTVLIYFFSKAVTRELRKLSHITSKGALNEVQNYQGDSRIIEISDLENNSRKFAAQILKYQELMLIREKDAAVGKASAQVAHDIRSPLSALEMLSSSINEIPEEKRTILRNSINRIRDIANSLVQNYEIKKTKLNAPLFIDPKSNPQNNAPPETELLMPIIDSLVTEKRIQFRDQLHIQIEFIQTHATYGIFSKINSTEFKRILSNLINNAVESLKQQQGKINVVLSSSDQMNLISIEDNGVGIPSEILNKLGERGASFNKKGGSGLGIYHAIQTIKNWRGEFKIESKEKKGTKVILKLIKESPPSWFVQTLFLKHGTVVVVFDDDQSIHEIWKDRLEKYKENAIRIIHLSTPSALRKFYGQNFDTLDQAVFLMDYEIQGNRETGLDLIEELGIQRQSILVTSRFEEQVIRERCERIQLKLIPKSMSGFVPIQLI